MIHVGERELFLGCICMPAERLVKVGRIEGRGARGNMGEGMKTRSKKCQSGGGKSGLGRTLFRRGINMRPE